MPVRIRARRFPLDRTLARRRKEVSSPKGRATRHLRGSQSLFRVATERLAWSDFTRRSGDACLIPLWNGHPLGVVGQALLSWL